MQQSTRDKRYKQFVISLGCIICRDAAEAHHVNLKGHGGKGTKTSDYRCLPLCRVHHNEYHNHGRQTFAEKYAIDYEKWIGILNRTYHAIHSNPTESDEQNERSDET